MSMKSLETIREMLCYELDDITDKGEMSAGMLDTVDKIAHAIKNIDKVMESEGGYSNDYSRDGNYSRNGEWYAMGNSNRGNSYRRDSMGRYSRRYSRDGADLKSRLEDLMSEAETDKEREAVRKALSMIDKQ